MTMAARDGDNVIPLKEAEAPPPSDLELAALDRNDLGNGKRLVARHGDDLLVIDEEYDPGGKGRGFAVWDGRRWKRDGAWAEVRGRAELTAEAIRDEFAALCRDDPEPDVEKLVEEGMGITRAKAEHAAWKRRTGGHLVWSIASGMQPRLAGMIAAAAPHLSRPRELLDADPLVVNCPNGTLYLHAEGEIGRGAEARISLRPHRREDLLTFLAGAPCCDPEAGAPAPRYRAFLDEVQPDREIQAFLQRFAGYCLSGLIGEQVVCCFHGGGANGKSTFVNVLHGILGEYARTLPFDALGFTIGGRGGQPQPEIARLPGSRAVMASEPKVGLKLAEDVIKLHTGGEPVLVRGLYSDPFEFTATHKLLLSFNNKPKVIAQDHGTWRRILMVPWSVQIPPEAQVRDLHRQLLEEEAPGIWNWLLDGWRMYVDQGLDPPEAVRAATQDYRAEGDPLSDWLQSDAVRLHDTAQTTASLLYDCYVLWCHANAREAVNQTRFGLRMPEIDGVVKEKAGGVMVYSGIEVEHEVHEQLREQQRRRSGHHGHDHDD